MAALFAAQPHALLLGRSPYVAVEDPAPVNVAVPHLIGLAGYAQSGKDSAAHVIEGLYGHRLASTGQCVAALLRDINPLVEYEPGKISRCADLLDEYGYEGAKAFDGMRTLMQDTGEQVKARAPRYWIDLLLNDPRATVVVGVRSPEEVDAIAAKGGVTFWVARPGVAAYGEHVNERRLSPADCAAVLHNDGDLTDLWATVPRLLTSWR